MITIGAGQYMFILSYCNINLYHVSYHSVYKSSHILPNKVISLTDKLLSLLKHHKCNCSLVGILPNTILVIQLRSLLIFTNTSDVTMKLYIMTSQYHADNHDVLNEVNYSQ